MEIAMKDRKRFESSTDYMTKRKASYEDISFTSLKIALSSKGFHINEESFAINDNLLTENGEYNQLAELLSDRNNLHVIFAKFRGKDKTSISCGDYSCTDEKTTKRTKTRYRRFKNQST